jgi:TetR/AcrR family transcriptional regulator, transcriptional repressor for nem operon
MPRLIEFDPEKALEQAMHTFWRQGFHATSINDLVTATGVSRFGLYAVFASKRDLFIAALGHYSDAFVSSAVNELTLEDSSIDALRNYFLRLIDIAAAAGLPGPGCLMANTMTEVAPHDETVRKMVAAHLERLRALFEKVLVRAASNGEIHVDFGHGIADHQTSPRLARALVLSAQGLWAASRIATSKQQLLEYVEDMLLPLEQPLTNRALRRKENRP